jgi:hypothetical protein
MRVLSLKSEEILISWWYLNTMMWSNK